jgi:hypothetical protein
MLTDLPVCQVSLYIEQLTPAILKAGLQQMLTDSPVGQVIL